MPSPDARPPEDRDAGPFEDFAPDAFTTEDLVIAAQHSNTSWERDLTRLALAQRAEIARLKRALEYLLNLDVGGECECSMTVEELADQDGGIRALLARGGEGV